LTPKSNTRTVVQWIGNHPVLGVQDLLNKPAYWHKIIIKMSGNEDRVTLSVQSDNLYITGFANKHGEFTFL
jgi:hypothetical protein